MLTWEYRFESLAQMAEYMESKARLIRDNASSKAKYRQREFFGEAAAWESAAHLVRHSKIGE